MKRLTTEQFIEKSILIHGDVYDYKNTIYIKNREKVKIICCKHGEFSILAKSHLDGRGCQLCSLYRNTEGKVKTIELFIQEAKGIHGDLYNYDNVIYVRGKEKVSISCDLHGNFTQAPNNHLNGQGCPKCAEINRKIKSEYFKTTLPSFIIKAKKVHGEVYFYNNVEYVNSHTKINIQCKTHGMFLQTPVNHINGAGCPNCARDNNGYSKSLYIKQAKGRKSELYLIKCFNENEEFYKVGITFKSVKKRFSQKESMPYSISIIHLIEGSAEEIYSLEKKLLKLFYNYKYLPKINFKGYTECFNTNLPITEIINSK